MDGTRQERHLLKSLSALAWEGIRSPGSGTQPRAAPDVLAGRDGVSVAVELKSGDPPANVEVGEVGALRAYAKAVGAAVVIAARWSGDRTFYLAPPALLKRTPSKHFSIPSDPERWPHTCRIAYDPTPGPEDYDVTVDQDDIPEDRVAPHNALRKWTANVRAGQRVGDTHGYAYRAEGDTRRPSVVDADE